MGRTDRPVAALERVEAILGHPAIYALAALIPYTDRSRGGRRRHPPPWAWLSFHPLLPGFGTARHRDARPGTKGARPKAAAPPR